MSHVKFVIFAGRELGVRALEACLCLNIPPELVIINQDEVNTNKKSQKTVQNICENNNIPWIGFKDIERMESSSLFAKNLYQVAFSTFCNRIIPDWLISRFTLGITNLHFSQLPKYKGQYPTVYAIFNGDLETAVTLHWINSKPDDGDIIYQQPVQIKSTDTGYTLFTKCLDVAEEIFKKQLFFATKNAWPRRKPQIKNSEKINHKLPNDGNLDWSWQGHKIERFLRALYHPNYPLPNLKIGNMTFSLQLKKESDTL